MPAVFRWRRRKAGLRAGELTPRYRRRAIAMFLASVVFLVVGLAGVASASNGDPNGLKTGTDQPSVTAIVPQGTPPGRVLPTVTEQVARDHLAINYSWLMVGGILVLFMQAGFALVETGFTRAKNASHTMMMNLVIFGLGTAGWFVCGYALMFGAVSNPALGITPVSGSLHIGQWNLLAHGGFFLGGHAYDV